MNIHKMGGGGRDFVSYSCLFSVYFQERNRPAIPNVERRVLVCSICFRSFRDITVLQEHLITHSNGTNTTTIDRRQEGCQQKDKPFICGMCSCKFPSATGLRIHMFLHSGESPTCEVCNGPFQSRKNLKKHMIIHEAIKTFKCDKCEMAFNRRNFLQRHIDTVHAEKTLKCDQCDCKFSHPTSLPTTNVLHIEILRIRNMIYAVKYLAV